MEAKEANQVIDGSQETFPLATPGCWRDFIPPQKKIAIVGTAEDSIKLAPYNDPEWQIWTLNNAAVTKSIPRWNVMFQMHHGDFVADGFSADHEWLKANRQGVVFMCADMCNGYSSAYPYPLNEVIGVFESRYFTNTISWMIALAILTQPEEIGIWGVNMDHFTEYSAQRASCEFWCGIAQGRGIKVSVAEQSSLLKCAAMYGVEKSPLADKCSARLNMLKERLARMESEKAQLEQNIHIHRGALEDCQFWATFMS